MRKKIVKLYRYPLLAVVLFSFSALSALEVNETADNVTLMSASDERVSIPDLGAKVVTIFYTDPDVSDQNDPFADLLKKEKLPKEYYNGIGVANLKDTWKPNWIIQAIVKRKIDKYKSTILLDPEHLLRSAWKLGDCDEKSIVIVIGKDKKVRYIKKGFLNEKEQRDTLALIKQLIENSR